MADADRASDGPRQVRIDDLRACLVAGFEALELSREHAERVAEVLVDSELRGYEDHGAYMLGYLANFYRTGNWNPRPNIRVVRESDGALLLDGDRGCGVIAATQAMRWCIERARARKGMAVAGVRTSNHFVAAAPYARMAAEAGLIGFACSNATAMVAPPGGRTRTFGTNPMAYGIPARRFPIVLDMATSTSALVKMLLAAQRGEPALEHVILDRDGRPTTDPNDYVQGGFMTPLGHPTAPYKGFGLALVVDVLAGVLTGAGIGREAIVNTSTTGQTFWALDVEAFLPLEEFLDRMDHELELVKSGERVEGVEELLVPGERGQRRYDALTARGMAPLSALSWDALLQACESLGVEPPRVVES